MLDSESQFHSNIPDEKRCTMFKKKEQPERKLPIDIWEHKHGWSEKIYG